MTALADRLAARTLELVDIHSESLQEHAIRQHLVALVPPTLHAEWVGEEAALFVPDRRADVPLVVLAGHYDTVPAQGNLPNVLLVMDNVNRVPREYVDISHTLGMRDSKVLRRVVLPAAAPAIWDTLRITLGWAWTWLVIAELVAASDGLGHRIIVAQRYFQTDTIFVGILVIGLLGLVMDQVMKFTGKRIFRWAE